MSPGLILTVALFGPSALVIAAVVVEILRTPNRPPASDPRLAHRRTVADFALGTPCHRVTIRGYESTGSSGMAYAIDVDVCDHVTDAVLLAMAEQYDEIRALPETAEPAP